jgi:hypothetical protein
MTKAAINAIRDKSAVEIIKEDVELTFDEKNCLMLSWT